MAAERLALSFGITAIADNTFAPSHLAKMAELSKADKLRLRVTSRSFGPMPITKMLMKSMGGSDDPRIRFFGDKFFVDRSMSDVGSKLARMAGLPFVTKRRSSRRYSASLAAMGSLAIGNGVPPPMLLPTWVIDTGAAVVNSGMDPLGRPLAQAENRTISISQALRGYGAWAARAMGRGDDLGEIAKGKFADFVILRSRLSRFQRDL